jgi:hypothetical protein
VKTFIVTVTQKVKAKNIKTAKAYATEAAGLVNVGVAIDTDMLPPGEFKYGTKAKGTAVEVK